MSEKSTKSPGGQGTSQAKGKSTTEKSASASKGSTTKTSASKSAKK